MSATLKKYLPEDAIPLAAEWFKAYKFHLRITKSRSTKFGDFRPAQKGKPNRISVNGDLNKYHFLITFTHEAAHAACWEKFKGKVLPHGKEWQSIYADFLLRVLNTVNLPEELIAALNAHLKSPKASSCSDPSLFKIIKNYDTKSEGLIYLENVDVGELFTINGRRNFRKGKKRRTRYECEELKSRRLYLVSGHAEVKILDEL